MAPAMLAEPPSLLWVNRLTMTLRSKGGAKEGSPSGKDIVTEADDIIELQGDVLLVRDAHIVDKRLWKKSVSFRLQTLPEFLAKLRVHKQTSLLALQSLGVDQAGTRVSSPRGPL